MANDDRSGYGSRPEEVQRLLCEIRELLAQRLPQPSPWWKRWPIISFLLAVVVGSLVVFPSEERRKADVVVTEGTPLALIIKPDPDWAKLGLPPNPHYRRIPDGLDPSVSVNTVLQVELIRQGLRYTHSGIRVARTATGVQVNLLSPAVIDGPTSIRISPVGSLDDREREMVAGIVRHYALRIGDTAYPFLGFISLQTFEGSLVIATIPSAGPQRLWSNIEKVLGRL